MGLWAMKKKNYTITKFGELLFSLLILLNSCGLTHTQCFSACHFYDQYNRLKKLLNRS